MDTNYSTYWQQLGQALLSMENLLGEILIHTYHPDANLRAHAEASFKKFLQTNGSFVALLNFVGNQSVPQELRLSCSIIIKNNARSYWKTDAENFPISIEEKEHSKTLIVNILLCEIENKVRSMLAETIRVIAEFDYPLKYYLYS